MAELCAACMRLLLLARMAGLPCLVFHSVLGPNIFGTLRANAPHLPTHAMLKC